MYVKVNGIDINVETQGAGAPLVLVHGLSASLGVWQADVARYAPHFRVMTYDTRGHGKSSRPARYTLQDHIEDLRALLDTMSNGPVTLLGASMGSYIAQGLASHYPASVAKLVLVAPKCHGTTSSSARILAEHADAIAGMTHRERQAFLLDKAFSSAAPVSVREAVLALELSDLLDEQAMAAASDALAGFDFRKMLPRVSASTLVICGRDDILNPPQAEQECAALIPECRYVEIADAGHFPGAEAPDRYYAALDAFLGVPSRP